MLGAAGPRPEEARRAGAAEGTRARTGFLGAGFHPGWQARPATPGRKAG